ncbi:MAG TPA: response regulator, partial [Vicinamibacteria bacterium]|nr:response regulator [Vicinamibacteria bacterium]
MSDSRTDDRARLRHDLRTPLHQIIGYAELLEDELKDAGQQGPVADLEKIQAAARRALELIDRCFPGGGAGAAAAVFRDPADDPAPQAGEPSLSAPLRPPSEPPEPGSVSLLVVDDNELNRDMLSRRLGSRGFQVSVAVDGASALAMIEQQEFSLVLLDVMMPGLTGIDVLKRLRERFSESDLPVVMATARDATEDVVEALHLGANDYVTKPLDFAVVLARIETQLTLRRQKQEIEQLARDLELRNRFIQSLFGRYVSDEVVADLLASPEGTRIGGEQRRVTLLMSDLRGFTPLTEGLQPHQVLRLLNSYLGSMADVVLAHQGTVDEFVGDAILAIFGAPVARADDARRAVACAVAMQEALAALNRVNEAEGLPRLEMGIAVHTGEVIV